MAKVKITDTTLRDGHQSLWATRMSIKDMLPIVEKLDMVGYHSLEVWGGATFDVCLRYLNEDPWERLRTLKRYIKRTPLQMLLRGQSLVGYQHYPDDVVEAFVFKMVENGIDIIRVFDALNDIRNMETSVRAGKKAGAHVQASVVYTVSPVHTTGHYLQTAEKLAEMGADSICVKDMAGLLTPYQAYELISKLRQHPGLPVQLHSHYIGGLALATYLKAVEAGVDVIDTAAVPLAFGASQPPVETVVRALQGTQFDTGLDMRLLFEIAGYFEELREQRGQERGVTRINDMRVFEHQVPGGMITNLVSQLKEQKSAHLLPRVLEEIPRVRRELGYPPLVTPTSQIVGTQAVLNVLTGERYKLIPGEVKAYIQGLYGRPPAPLEEAVARRVLGDKQPITCRPADLLEPRLEKIKLETRGLTNSNEDILCYAIFPQITKKFLEARKNSSAGNINFARDTGAAGVGGSAGGENTAKTGCAAEKANAGTATAQNISDRTSGAPGLPGHTTKEVNEMDIQQIKELISMINETNIDEFSLNSDGMKLSIKKASGDGPCLPHAAAQIVSENCSSLPTAAQSREDDSCMPHTAGHNDAAVSGTVVKAPMVGTFYRSPAPDADPFIKIGTRVEKGQTLCILEAMKLMNEIEAEVAGTVVQILAENAQAVEYGQPLLVIQED
ncbi:acetyl-CoA carboxylase biotin carboxyl carrier protein [Desulfoscipio gibsoniae]|uniref:Acetyl-CoA carboxylase, biotin carboxyl carrier protein n=1 Tax=Desulfoscipio gibsoniae DSM 7213 TaxID=767817 RepID=R4KQY8_9FIRM|nr:acetyl-CoA carboxylase biotin carboxyl carrier protein [Desulfoscipio gibsoniae]AGL02021.1 acetyl-CoA carboxylase, biotin carboxyl carrier protein [Desulfoscipio gibsoniae DSM 7213]